MMTAPIDVLSDLTPVIDEHALYRYLGYPEGKMPEGRVVDVLRKQEEHLPDLLEPCAVYAHVAGRACFDRGFVLHDREVALCVATIGGKLEAKAAGYAAQGDVLAAFVLDTLGSVYAEGTAEAAYRKLAEAAQHEGLELGCRISPGYGTWTLSYQSAIFDLLPAHHIGVRLTSGLMMVPRKSVSFAAERSVDPVRLREGEQCACCQMQNCRYRHA